MSGDDKLRVSAYIIYFYDKFFDIAIKIINFTFSVTVGRYIFFLKILHLFYYSYLAIFIICIYIIINVNYIT